MRSRAGWGASSSLGSSGDGPSPPACARWGRYAGSEGIEVEVADRGHGDDLEREPVQKIVTETPFVRLDWKVAVGGADHADVDVRRSAGAETLELSVLDHAKNLFLDRRVRASAAKTIAERKEVRRALDRIREAQAEWQRKAEVALTKDREDLSRGALVEKTKLVENADALEGELSTLEHAIAHADSDIVKLEAKLKEAKAKQKTIDARRQTASSRLKIRRHLYESRIDDAFARFEVVERRLDATEGEVEAFDLGRSKTLNEEIADLEAQNGVEEELRAMKQRLAKGAAGAQGS
jgi:phage shock protein A